MDKWKEDKKTWLSIPVKYLVLVGLWVTVSTIFVSKWTGSVEHFEKIELMKGLATVIVTAWIMNRILNQKWKELRKTEESLLESEGRLRTLINAMPDFVCFKDGQGRWLEANDFAIHTFGLEKNSYQGKTDAELGSLHPAFKNLFTHCSETDEQVWRRGSIVRTVEKIHRSGEQAMIFDVIKVPVYTDEKEKKGLVIIGRDITEQKKVEEKLGQSQKQYQSAVNHVKEVIYQTDADGRWTFLNPAWTEITGYAIEESIGQSCLEFICPEDRNKYNPCYKVLMEGKRELCKQEVRYAIKGGGFRWVEIYATLTRNEEGHIMGTSGTITDITERKETEELLRKSDKLSVVGQLAAGVAHEIRNPLTSIKGFVQLLKTKDQENPYYYDIMLSEMDRINFIVSEFLMLSKPQILHFEDNDLEQLLDNVVTLLNTQAILKNIEILCDIEQGLPPIYCAENPIKQVFINILKNAMEAMPNGGQIMIRAQRQQEKIAIYFIDQGCGISPERIPKLGEPFYSTKENGTGLGLMVSYKIIEDHSGTIQIRSVKDRGTVVEVAIPVHATVLSK